MRIRTFSNSDNVKCSFDATIGALLLIAIAGCAASRSSVPVMTATGATASLQMAPFVGTWKLVKQEGRNVQTGDLIPASTSDAWPGLLIYSSDGWMSVAIDRRASGGTYWGYYGTFSVTGDTIIHNIAGGVPSVRGPSPAIYKFENDRKRLLISTIPTAAGTVVSFFFERAQ